MSLQRYIWSLHWFLKVSLLLTTLFVFWLAIAYGFPKILPTVLISNTSKSGFIIQNERWSGEVNITGDIWALPGTTVVIDPGTQIKVRSSGDNFNLHILPWGLRSGLNTGSDWFGVKNGELFWDEGQKIQIRLSRVYGIGTPQQPIRLYSDTTDPSPYDFNIFSVKSGVLSFWRFSNYRRFLLGDELTIRDSEFRQTAECALCIEYMSPSIINNVFFSSLREQIFIVGGSPKINNNLFNQNPQGVGILIDPQTDGSPEIYHNDFEVSFQYAIKVISGSEEVGGTISSNNFAGNSIVEIPCDSRLKFSNNQIRGVIKMKHSGNCIGSLEFGDNYWTTADKDTILREKFRDIEPQFKISIPNILLEIPKSGREVKAGKV